MARSTYAYWVFIAILVFLHFALHVGFGLEGAAPDLLVVATLFGARRLRAPGAALVGLGLGLLEDALSVVAFGASALALSILGFLGARSRDLFEGDSLLFVAVYIFLGKWLRDAVHVALTDAERGTLLSSSPLAALYAAIAGLVALGVYRAVTGER